MNIRNIYKKLTVATLAVTALASCSKYLEEAYIDPNRPVEPNVETVLPPIANNWAQGIFFDSRFIGALTQNFVSAGANNLWDRHGWDQNFNSVAGGEVWRQHYWAVGSNLKYMIEKGAETQQWDYVGLSYAMFAYSWQTAGDIYGELIVSQAFDATRQTFDFESQELAYKLAGNYCDSAIKYLQLSSPRVTANSLMPGDAFLYGGNRTLWLRFAYGIKARNFHRWSRKSSGYMADSVIRYVDSSLRSSAEDATVKFAGGITTQSNFYGQLRANLGNFRQSQFIVGLMNGATGTAFAGVVDPRRGNMLWPSADGTFRGVAPIRGEVTAVPVPERVPNPYGLIAGAIPTADTGRFIYRNTAVLPLLTYAELQFLKAEAAFIKGDRATALTAYTNGINGHFDMLNQSFGGGTATALALRFTPATRAAYLANPAVVPTDASNLTLAMIMNQKYIALYFHGHVETWVDLRRYNYSATVYPSFTVPTGADLFPDNNGKLAARMRPRPQVEYTWNLASIQAIGGLDIDYHTKPVWFQIP